MPAPAADQSSRPAARSWPRWGRERPGFHSGHYIAVTAVSGGWFKYRVTDPWDGNVTSLTDAQLETFITSNPKGGFTISAW